ncbi:MAG TPA: peptidyl-prolyl cis-trans isomerase [Myxococcota bacterium]|nr:peptidyl-prolyl cis-trans isomerase [Myxococcota bacterium]
MWRTLLRFGVLGALLFAGDRLFLREARRPAPVVVSAARLEALRIEALRMGGAQGEATMAAIVQAEVDDELLYRRALAEGLDRDDPVVAQRLVQNLRFAGADPSRDDASLLAEARELGLDRSDPVVRRRLVQLARMQLELADPGAEPAEAELRERYAADAARYQQPARTRFAQLYFARGHEELARETLARLRAASTPPADAASSGEPFLHPFEQPAQADAELAARFGREFAESLAGLPEQSWQGPVPSAYGQHLVYVEGRTPAGQAPFESVREPVRLSLLAERRARALERELARMREGVEVVVQAAPGAARSEAQPSGVQRDDPASSGLE